MKRSPVCFFCFLLLLCSAGWVRGQAPSPIPPDGAIVLYDGTAASVTANWVRAANQAAPNWPSTDGYMSVQSTPAPNDIVTKLKFIDFQLHAEFYSPGGGSGQLAGNSGIKMQRRYELQILNTPGSKPLSQFGNDDVGSIYLTRKPDVNASTGPDSWQSYDVFFTAARWAGTTKRTNARMTVYWNGVLVHNDVAVPDSTGASPNEAPGADSILLQQHQSAASGPVRFRNLWVVPASTGQQLFTDWAASYGLTGPPAATQASPQGDGVTNLWKYAAGADPTKPLTNASGHSYLPTVATTDAGNGRRWLDVHFRRRTDAGDRGLTYTIETTPNLQNPAWSARSSTPVEPPVATENGATEMVTLRVDEPIANAQIFARVRVELR